MSVKQSTASANAMINALGAALADGCAEIYSGAQPATADSPIQGTLLAIVTKSGGAWTAGSPTNGLSFDTGVAGTIAKPTADEWKFTGLQTGTAGWIRFKGNAADAGGTSTALVRLDCAIGSAGAELTLSNVNIVVGVPGAITTFSITMPTA